MSILTLSGLCGELPPIQRLLIYHIADQYTQISLARLDKKIGRLRAMLFALTKPPKSKRIIIQQSIDKLVEIKQLIWDSECVSQGFYN